MAKQRKTRKEKIRSENRQEHVFATPGQKLVSPQEDQSFSFSFTSEKNISRLKSDSQKLPESTENYAFVKHDLIKTTAVVGSIVVAELLLFLIIR